LKTVVVTIKTLETGIVTCELKIGDHLARKWLTPLVHRS